MKKKFLQIIALSLAIILCSCGAKGNTAPGENTSSNDNTSAEGNNMENNPRDTKTFSALLNEEFITENPPKDNYMVFYELFVYSFFDSDGDGIGDLRGAASKLDYIKDLGVGGIWLMPINPSTSYHKYDVIDYYDIDREYGTLEDFEYFLSECKKRDLKVIMDLVLNHSSSAHPWFIAATDYLKTLKAGEEPDPKACPYVDYYNFTRNKENNNYRIVNGTDFYYEGVFSERMPDLNLGNEEIRAEIKKIMKYWIDKGVHGFRLDAAKEYYTGFLRKNVEVLSFLQNTLKEIKPDGYLVAEVWESFTNLTDYYESQITSMFNFPFADGGGKIPEVLRAAGNEKIVTTYATALEKADKAYLKNNPGYIDAPFLSNHDTGRIYGFVSGDEGKLKLAAAMNLFMGGASFVYYGEELGMPGSGNDPSKRAPMLWNEARDGGTTGLPPECSLPESYPFKSLEVQQKDMFSVYNYYKDAIRIRNALPVISHGRVTAEEALNKGCVSAFRKTWEDRECIILMNVSPEKSTADLTGYSDFKAAALLSADGHEFVFGDDSITLPAYGTAVLVNY